MNDEILDSEVPEKQTKQKRNRGGLPFEKICATEESMIVAKLAEAAKGRISDIPQFLNEIATDVLDGFVLRM